MDSHNTDPDQASQPTQPENYTPEQQSLHEPEKSSLLKRIKEHKVFLPVVVVLVLVLVAGGAFMAGRSTSDSDTTTATETSDDSNIPSVEEVQNNIPKETRSDISWLGDVQKLPYQPVFSEASVAEFYYLDSFDEKVKESFTFYKIGTDGGDDILFMEFFGNGIGSNYAVVLKTEDGYKIMKNHSDAFSSDGTFNGPAVSPGTTIDLETTYFDIVLADNIAYNDTVVSRTGAMQVLDSKTLSELTEVEKIENGTVYERVATLDGQDGIKQFSIFLKQPSGTFVSYRYTTDVLQDDNSVTINWNDGSTTTDTYQWAMVWAGCGSVNSVNVLDKAYFNDLQEIGKVGAEPIYRLNRADHPAVKTVYNAYGEYRDGAVSRQAFYDDNGMIVVRNKLGYRVVLVKDTYQRAAECAKPVIYLYPEVPMPFTVSVGADVTKSEPQYRDGWSGYAYPNGLLAVDGQIYDSLFWDGTGHGNYPEITNGFVVQRSDLEDTLWSHLAQLGLNQKEATDFMEFWMPLMPDSPYVRLTWFGTEQMNELAPLYLSEQPDTLIRIFLDYEGLNEPIALDSQLLVHPPREGFTVIEWGGLRTY